MDEDEIRHIRGNRIAMVFQEPMTSLNPVLTIGRQLTEALELHLKLDNNAARSSARSSCWRWSASRRRAAALNDYPHQFSGGMRQRVMIAMALSCNPKLLLADEPTTALDVTIQAQILEIMARLSRELGTAVVIITHNLGVVARYADRVNVMYAGKIVEMATATELYANPRHPYTVGLLKSVPRLDQSAQGPKLDADRGLPPDLVQPAAGLPVLRRAARTASTSALTEMPPLMQVGDKHQAACWVMPDGRHADRVERRGSAAR